MNYAREALAIRQERDAAVERARAAGLCDGTIWRAQQHARHQLADLAAARDAEIRRLRAAEPSLSMTATAVRVGCSSSTVSELLDPERRAEHNRRRLEHWRALAASRRERSDESQAIDAPVSIDDARRSRAARSGSSTDALPVGA
jgi:hypothetical protein